MWMGWGFALCSVLSFADGIWLIWATSGVVPLHGSVPAFERWLIRGVLPAEAVVFAAAWWFVWRNKPHARLVGIAASSVLILDSLWSYLWHSRPLWALLVFGLSGIVVFVGRDEVESSESQDGGDAESASE